MTPNLTELTGFFRILSNPSVSTSLPSTSTTALQTSSPSSFTLDPTAGDLLNGTLSGLTLAAAALGSPALSKVCSHPLFAGAALLVGASHQVTAWGQVNGFLSGALLFLSTIATAINGYSFYRGLKAGWRAWKEATRLAVYDRVRTLQDEAESRLDKAVKRTAHPVLVEAKKLAEETHANVKAAVEHFKDLRDEKPQRIIAARLSGLAANPEVETAIRQPAAQAGAEAVAEFLETAGKEGRTPNAAPLLEVARRSAQDVGEAFQGLKINDLTHLDEDAYKALRQRMYQAMSGAFQRAVADGASPEDAKAVFRRMGERIRDSLDTIRSDAFVLAAKEGHVTVQRGIEQARSDATAAAEKAALGSRLVPAMISRMTGRLDPETAEDVQEALKASKEIERLLATTIADNGALSRWSALPPSPKKKKNTSDDEPTEPDPRGYVRKTYGHAVEAQRVASASPRNWVSEAIGDPVYSPVQRIAGGWLGGNLNSALLYALPALATLQMITGGTGFFQWLLNLAPAAAVYLYNARQGRTRFNVSPAPTQALPFERYGEEELQKKTSERLDKAVPPLEPGEEKRFADTVRTSQDGIDAHLDALEKIDVPLPKMEPAAITADLPWMQKKAADKRRFTPIPNPGPNRRYRYDHRPGGPDTEEKKAIRTAIKSMPLDQLDDAIRRGEVTHVDILNMICDHPAAQQGAVFPRPLTGKLRRALMKKAREADRLGIIRHFVAVKDLFPGIDGVVTAGSKTTYLTDLGKSPLVQKVLEEDIAVPCGLTAGANGGSGLYNGHGAVGNPTTPLHDTAGSSSAEAYVLGLEDMPIRLAVGTDTGGSISAPCGAVGLFGFVPEKGTFSRVNMIPYATHLDTPGVMGVDHREVLAFAKRLTVPAYQQRFDVPVKRPPVYYFESDVALASEGARANFARQLQSFRDAGLEVIALDKSFSPYRQIPLDLYPDSYVGAAFTLMNPLQENAYGEAPRYVLDRNLQNRLAKANVLLKEKDDEHGNLYNRFLSQHVRFRDLFRRKFPEGSVFVAPPPEAVPLEDFKPNGPAGVKLDSHDLLGGMLKNRVDNALYVDPERRLVIEGRTADVLAVAFGKSAAKPAVLRRPILVPEDVVSAEEMRTTLLHLYPTLEDATVYGKLVGVLSKKIVKAGGSIQDAMEDLYGDLSRIGRQDLVDQLRADEQNRRDRDSHERLQARAPGKREAVLYAS